MNLPPKNGSIKSKIMTAFENLLSIFKSDSSKQEKESSEKKTTRVKTKKPDPKSVNLSSYIDNIFEHPKVLERFPVKPLVLHSNDVKFQEDGHRKNVCLGSGQMGTVYLGRMKKAGKNVAVKVATDPRCTLNFMIHEAALMTYLNDTGSTPHCYGLLPLASSSSTSEEVPMAALVMDIVGGDPKSPRQDLENFIKLNKGKLSVKAWKALFIQICEQIHKIHRRGIIMNDIKEENMLVTKTGVDNYAVQMIDFGSSKFGNYSFPIDPKLTRAEFREEYSHVAPEIYKEARVNEITDVFSLASIFCDAGRYLNIGDLIIVGIKCGRTDPSMRPDVRTIINMLSDIRE